MRGPRGYITITEPGKALIERDTGQCPHCSGIIELVPGQSGGVESRWCSQCGKHICARCAQHATCRPFEKWLEAVERRARLPG